jgi:aryl-alcohol dehydrogenase-like predicted oxidoreductase
VEAAVAITPDLSEIALGLAALGRPGYMNLGHAEDLGPDRSVDALERRTHEVLDAARAENVRWFDAARSYGRAEEFLGSWLPARDISPGELIISSKWGYTYTAGWRVDADPPEVKDLSVDAFRRQLAETRELLGDHLTIYQIHSATIESGVLEDEAVVRALAELRANGTGVGFTATGPDQAATIARAVELDAFDSVQATWNLLERSADGELRRAHDAGLTVIVKEAVANGRLTDRGHHAVLDRVARRAGATPDAVALAAVLAQPWTDVVLSGASTVDQLHSNLAAREVELDDATLYELEGLEQDAASYWSERSALSWT